MNTAYLTSQIMKQIIKMSLYNTIKYGLFSTGGSGFSGMVQGVVINDTVLTQNNGKNNISVAYTCSKILSETLAMLPVEGNIFERPNDYQNHQQFKQEIETYRNTTGTTLVQIHKKNGGDDWYSIVPPECIQDWKWMGGRIYYLINYKLASELHYQRQFDFCEWIEAKHFLVFRGVPMNAAIGMSAIQAGTQNLNILNSSTTTLNSIYDNRLMPTLAIEYESAGGSGARGQKEERDKFERENGGAVNAGKTINLPAGAKAVPLSISMVDAQVMEVIKFSRDEIATMFGLQNYLLNENDSNWKIEDQTRALSRTMAPIVAAYESEIEFKTGKKVKHDLDAIVEMDLVSKVNAWGTAVEKALVTPQKASTKFGDYTNNSEAAQRHYSQAQLLSLENREADAQMMKGATVPKTDDPAAKQF